MIRAHNCFHLNYHNNNDGFISLDIVINIWSEAPGTGVDNMSSFTIYI